MLNEQTMNPTHTEEAANGLTAEEQAVLGNGKETRRKGTGKHRKSNDSHPTDSGLTTYFEEQAGQIETAAASFIERIVDMTEEGTDIASDALVALPHLWVGLLRQKVEAKGGMRLDGGKSFSPSTSKVTGAYTRLQTLLAGTTHALPLKSAALIEAGDTQT